MRIRWLVYADCGIVQVRRERCHLDNSSMLEVRIRQPTLMHNGQHVVGNPFTEILYRIYSMLVSPLTRSLSW